MEELTTPAKFGALDLMILGVFFISYSVLGLTQIAMLFSRRFITFMVLGAISAVIAQSFVLLDFTGFCSERSSVILCGSEKQELVGLGMVWVIVSFAMLAVYGMARALQRLRTGG
jgi:hypothetical protein